MKTLYTEQNGTHYLLSDEPIKTGDWYFDKSNGAVTRFSALSSFIPFDTKVFAKILASHPKIEGVPEIDMEYASTCYWKNEHGKDIFGAFELSRIKEIYRPSSPRMFTEEQAEKIALTFWTMDVDEFNKYRNEGCSNFNDVFKKIIASLSPSTNKLYEVEIEMNIPCIGKNRACPFHLRGEKPLDFCDGCEHIPKPNDKGQITIQKIFIN